MVNIPCNYRISFLSLTLYLPLPVYCILLYVFMSFHFNLSSFQHFLQVWWWLTPSAFVCLGKFVLLHIWRITLPDRVFLAGSFFIRTLRMYHSTLSWMSSSLPKCGKFFAAVSLNLSPSSSLLLLDLDYSIYFWLHCGLCCYMGFSLVVERRGYSLVAVCGFLIVVASLVKHSL